MSPKDESNSKKNQPLPAVEINEISDTDLDDIVGGCPEDSGCGTQSCAGSCATTTDGKKVYLA
jgi:hypothetical protein